MSGCLILTAALFAAPPAIANEAEGLVTFIHHAGERELARELVRFDAEGFETAGRRGKGAGWWFYELTVRADDGATVVQFDSSSSHGDVEARASIVDEGCFTPGRDEAWLSWPNDPDRFVFVFDSRLVATHARPAAELARRARAGLLREGDALLGVDVLGRKRRDLTVSRFRRLEAGNAAYWRFALEDGDRDLHLLCDDNGRILRAESEDIGLYVARAGFEDAPQAAVHSTAIDEGPWRRLLPKSRFSTIEEKNQRVKMRDGVHLATDVFRPDTEERVPTVLVRTPYLRGSENLIRPGQYVPKGYAVVVQDVRGRGGSEGEFDPLVTEERDGSDTLDWIAAQPWSDGNVGMIGASYVAWVQWFAAKSRNPHLKAIIPIVSPPDIDENFPYEGGVPMLLIGWWAAVLDAMDDDGFTALPVLEWMEVLATLPLSELDTAVETDRPWVDHWLTTPPEDPYWDPRRYHPAIPDMNVPALHISGWFDGDQPGALLNFKAMRDRGPESVRAHQYLIMGPWGHGVNLMRRLGDVDFGDKAVIDLDSICLRFFDRYLRGIPNGIDEEDPVLYFTIGDNAWQRTTDWPPPSTEPVRLFLHGNGAAHLRDGDGRLAPTPPESQDAPPDEYRYDPLDPRPVYVEFNDVAGNSAMEDHSKIEDTEDVLDFVSPPLAEPVELTGPFVISLMVSTDAADTDFAAELFRVDPDGTMRLFAGGIQRLRYRLGPSVNRPVPPGEVVRVDIDGWAHSVRLEPGVRLHLQISSTQYPGMARNLNTLEPLTTARDAVVATNRVYHDAVRPSFVLLPVSGGTSLRFER